MTAEPASPTPPPSELASVVERNIATLIERRRADERNRTGHERAVEGISRFTGSMRFIYLHVAIFGLWIAINLGLVPLPRFDHSFGLLATVASVEAIFLSTIVLITQNRMAAAADKRADLDLQVSLLAEHEITRVITLSERGRGAHGDPVGARPRARRARPPGRARTGARSHGAVGSGREDGGHGLGPRPAPARPPPATPRGGRRPRRPTPADRSGRGAAGPASWRSR